MSQAYGAVHGIELLAYPHDKMPEVKEGSSEVCSKGREREWGSGEEVHSDAHEKLQLPCPPPMTIKEPCGRHKWRNRPTIAAIAVTCVTPRRNS